MSKTLFYNAKVYVDKGVFAEAVYQEDGWIKFVGSSDEALSLSAEDAEKIDCGGKTLIPGLNDSHLHLWFTGQLMMLPDLSKVKNGTEMVAAVKKYVEDNPGISGVYAQSFDQNKWDDPTIPTCRDLDTISADIPIVLTRSCGHIGTCNSYVLKKLGIDKDHAVWEGGRIDLFEDGSPSGVMAEAPIFEARKCVPPLDRQSQKKALITAMEYASRHGMTSCQSNDIGMVIPDHDYTFSIVDEVFREGKALLRYTAQQSITEAETLRTKARDPQYSGSFYDGWLNMGPLKMFKDGSYGGHSALMRRDYLDQPGNRGVETIGDEAFCEMVRAANENGMQVVTHCIGDEAIEKVADCYIAVAKEKGKNPCRNAVVHCQTMDVSLRKKLVDADILVMYQPVFIRTDMYGLEERIGKEMCYSSNCPRTMLEMGAHLSFGTDSPVEDCNPFVNIYVAVTRKDMNGDPEGGWYPDECVDVETAIDAYTAESAYAEFCEGVKGRIKPGFYADLTLIDRDIFTCDPMEIKDILPVFTMCGGRFTYRA